MLQAQSVFYRRWQLRNDIRPFLLRADNNSFYRSKGCRDLVEMGRREELSKRELGSTWPVLQEALVKLMKIEKDEDVQRFATGVVSCVCAPVHASFLYAVCMYRLLREGEREARRETHQVPASLPTTLTSPLTI